MTTPESSPAPTLDECVTAVARNPQHVNARYWAERLVHHMDLLVSQNRLTEERREEYRSMLATVLASADRP